MKIFTQFITEAEDRHHKKVAAGFDSASATQHMFANDTQAEYDEDKDYHKGGSMEDVGKELKSDVKNHKWQADRYKKIADHVRSGNHKAAGKILRTFDAHDRDSIDAHVDKKHMPHVKKYMAKHANIHYLNPEKDGLANQTIRY